MKIVSAVEWLEEQMKTWGDLPRWQKDDIIQQAKEMEKEQLFLASNILAAEAYKAGQESMYCGCYDIDGCTTYEEWLYLKN